MENKTKLMIVVGAAVFLLTVLIIIISSSGRSKTLRLEREQLVNENATLSRKAEDAVIEVRRLKEKIDALNNDMVRLSQEKEELQSKNTDLQRQYEVAVGDRDVLKDRLLRQPVLAPVVKEEPKAAPAVPPDTYWTGVLNSKVNLELQLEKAQDQLKELQLKSEDLQREKSTLAMDITNLTHDKKDLEAQLEYTQKMTYNVSSELVLEKNMKNQLRDRLQSLKNENSILRRQLKSLSTRKATLEKKYAELETEKSSIERRFNEMALLLEDRLSGISELKEQLAPQAAEPYEEMSEEMTEEGKESVELSPIVVRPQDKPSIFKMPSAPPRRGRIMELNKDNNFAIVDMGEEIGVKLGDRLKVYRDYNVIAELEVIEVRNKISACDIKSQTTSLMVGDEIR